MSGLLRLIIIIVIVIAGYWAYYVFAASDPNDRLGVSINERMPMKAREFACKKLKERFGDIPSTPAGCEPFAEWAPVAPPAPAQPKA